MRMPMILSALALVALCASVLAPSTAAAEDAFAHQLLCAPASAFECGPGGECARIEDRERDFPAFLLVDLDAMTVRGMKPSGEQLAATIETSTKGEDFVSLQGVQEGKAWSMRVSLPTARFVLSVAADGAGFSVFGNCMSRDAMDK